MSPALLGAALALSLAAAGGAPAEAGGKEALRPLSFEQHAVPNKVRLGDPFVYELRIAHPRDQRYELRAPRDLTDLEITSQERSRQDDADRAVTTFRLHMAAFQLGTLPLPALTFDVVGADPSGASGSSSTFTSPGAEIEVVGTLTEEAAQNGEALYDIRPPADVPVRTYRLLWALAGLAAAAALAYAAVRWLKRPRAAAAVEARPKEPLDVRTRRALDELRAQDLPGQGRFKEFHFRLSELLRAYLGERYGFDALESTSFELLDQLRRRHTPGLDFGALEQQVRDSDLVKFARGDTTPEACKRDLELAYRLVQSTTFSLAPPGVPGAPTAPRDAA